MSKFLRKFTNTSVPTMSPFIKTILKVTDLKFLFLAGRNAIKGKNDCIELPKEEPKTKCYCGHTDKCDCGNPGISEFHNSLKTNSITEEKLNKL